MSTPKLTTLDLAVLLHVSGGANTAKQELKDALESVKKSVESLRTELASGSSGASNLLMPMMMMMMTSSGSGSSGAPAQLGVPEASPTAAPAVAATPAGAN